MRNNSNTFFSINIPKWLRRVFAFFAAVIVSCTGIIFLPTLSNVIQTGTLSVFYNLPFEERISLVIVGIIAFLALILAALYVNFYTNAIAMNNIRKNLAFIDHIYEYFDSENPGDYHDLVYNQLIKEIQNAKDSITILTIPQLAEDAISGETQSSADDPNSRPIRRKYLLKLEQQIKTCMATNTSNKEGFCYKRLYQVDRLGKSEEIDNFEANGHVKRMRTFIETDGEVIKGTIEIKKVETTRNTGFIIIDDTTLIIQESAVAKNGLEFMVSLFIYEYRREDKTIRDYRKRYNDIPKHTNTSPIIMFPSF